jgi:CopA family copper-resistance protein
MAKIDRRKFLSVTGLTMGALAIPAWARGAQGGTLARKGSDVLSGEHLIMTVTDNSFVTGKRHGPAVTVNGTLPGPLVRLKVGQTLVADLHNHSSGDSSVHWHGLLVPFLMDGVPGVTQAAVKPGESFHYEFPIRQSGTYWWHAHTLQEPMGNYGPIVIDPLEPDPFTYGREYVLMLSDWSPMRPKEMMKKLRTQGDYFNYHQTSWTDHYKLSGAQRRMWARMRMSPTDISDVTGSTYSYLVNGHGPEDGLELAFNPGERIRLRIVNSSAMTFFNVRIPGLPMTVVAADGQLVNPVETDEFQMGVAETYDVLVEPKGAEAFAFVAEAIDRSGMGLAMLASRRGAKAAIPPLRAPPLLTMVDMGMGPGGKPMVGMKDDSGSMGGNEMPAMNMGGGNDTAGMDGAGMDMSGGMKMRDTSKLPAFVEAGPGLGMVAVNPVSRMDYPGLGLEHVGHRVLNYTQLAAARPNPDKRTPTRLKEIHLTGNMERYMWSFDGKNFSAVTDDPIRFAFMERVRVRLVNDTMMAHPIHLHGHFFELDNGAPDGFKPRKHTVNVQPGGTATWDLTADAPGDWAFHCHLFYHMHQGMFQIVTVRPLGEGDA